MAKDKKCPEFMQDKTHKSRLRWVIIVRPWFDFSYVDRSYNMAHASRLYDISGDIFTS